MTEVESSWDSFLDGDKDEEVPEGTPDSQEEVETPPTPPPELPKPPTTTPTTPTPPVTVAASAPVSQPAEDKGAPPARKAQRTRRAKVNVSNQSSPAKVSNADAPSGGKKQAVIIAPADEAVGSEDYEEDEEPSAVLNALSGVMDFIFSLLKGVWNLLKAIFRAVKGYLPGLVGVTLLYVTVYLLATYSVSPSSTSDLPDLSARLHYLIRAHVWSLLPVALGLLFGFLRNNDKHFRFARDSFEQAVLLFLNTVVLVTYASADNFHWLWSLLVGLLIFRFVYWIGVLYGGSMFRRIMSAPTLFINITMAIYNFGIVIGQDLGYIALDETPPPQPEAVSGPSFWDYQSLCHVMEKAFCAVDGTTPSEIRQYYRH